MAKLADAQDLGSCDGNIVWVQVPLSVLINTKISMKKSNYFNFLIYKDNNFASFLILINEAYFSNKVLQSFYKCYEEVSSQGINGFRKKNVPIDLIELKYGPMIIQEVRQNIEREMAELIFQDYPNYKSLKMINQNNTDVIKSYSYYNFIIFNNNMTEEENIKNQKLFEEFLNIKTEEFKTFNKEEDKNSTDDENEDILKTQETKFDKNKIFNIPVSE
jgi:hypothetical protein